MVVLPRVHSAVAILSTLNLWDRANSAMGSCLISTARQHHPNSAPCKARQRDAVLDSYFISKALNYVF